eukprot:m.339769 g.339769  ORF g.339769 m.339769 type:complete len:52 (-) comp55753_c0_seq3:1839-1994(-)
MFTQKRMQSNCEVTDALWTCLRVRCGKDVLLSGAMAGMYLAQSTPLVLWRP